MSEHKAFFRPKARLIKILGEHLIRDNTVGVLELIKNSYDADAEEITLLIEDIKKPETTQIVIEDDGIGMDSDIIEGRWFEPAHGAKDDFKRKLQKSKKGRIPLGEKGVGRFAVQKLGRVLELTTRPYGKDYEIYMKINWDEFEDSAKFIHEIMIPYSKRKPQYFKDEKAHGTLMRITNIREKWAKSELTRLQAALIRLRSPGVTDNGFNLAFWCPDFPEFENLDKGDVLNRFQFCIECDIDEKGFVHYKYTGRTGNGEEKTKEESCDLWSEVGDKSKSSKNPVCGPFKVKIYAWLRAVQNLKNFGLTREHLLELAGVSIFRDGFRILPYGDPGDDWLRLDERRINVPAVRVGNRQIMGFVELSQEKNQYLVDKTNREGLQENPAFFDMKELVMGCVAKLEQEMQPVRKKVSKTGQSKKEKLEGSIEELKKELEEMKVAAKKYETSFKEKSALDEESSDKEPEQEVVHIPKEKLEDFEEKYAAVCNSIKEYVEADDDNRQVFLHLVGIGLAAERFSHEFERMVHSIYKANENLKKKYGRDIDIKDINLFTNALKNEVRLMSVMRYIKGSPREGKTSTREILKLILLIHQDDFKRENIEVIEPEMMDDIMTRIPDFSVAQILDNIIINTIYWLSTKTQKNDRKVRIYFDEKGNSVLITNNGPRLASHVKSNLFKLPFVSAKPHGRGLGMYICSEILNLYRGNIRAVTPEEDQRVLSIGFRVDFSKYIKK